MRVTITTDDGEVLDTVSIDVVEAFERMHKECETPTNPDTVRCTAHHAAEEATETIASEIERYLRSWNAKIEANRSE